VQGAHLNGVTTVTAAPVVLTAHAVAADWVYPNLPGVGGAGQLKTVIGALMTIVLIVAVLMIVICAVAWAVSASHGNYRAVGKARAGLFVALGAAALDGAGMAWLDFLLHLGSRL
jgi:hypothetical protein